MNVVCVCVCVWWGGVGSMTILNPDLEHNLSLIPSGLDSPQLCYVNTYIRTYVALGLATLNKILSLHPYTLCITWNIAVLQLKIFTTAYVGSSKPATYLWSRYIVSAPLQ